MKKQCIICNREIFMLDSDNEKVNIIDDYCFECHITIKIGNFILKPNNIKPIKVIKNKIHNVTIEDFNLEYVLLFLYSEEKEKFKLKIFLDDTYFYIASFGYCIIKLNNYNKIFKKGDFKLEFMENLQNTYFMIYNLNKLHFSEIVKIYGFIMNNFNKPINFEKISKYENNKEYLIDCELFGFFPILPIYNIECDSIHINNLSYMIKDINNKKKVEFKCNICNKILFLKNFFIIKDILKILRNQRNEELKYDKRKYLVINNMKFKFIEKLQYNKKKRLNKHNGKIIDLTKKINNEIDNKINSNLNNNKVNEIKNYNHKLTFNNFVSSINFHHFNNNIMDLFEFIKKSYDNINDIFEIIFLIFKKYYKHDEFNRELIINSINFGKNISEINSLSAHINSIFFLLNITHFFNNIEFQHRFIIDYILKQQNNIIDDFRNILILLDKYKILNILEQKNIDLFKPSYWSIVFLNLLRKYKLKKMEFEFLKIIN